MVGSRCGLIQRCCHVLGISRQTSHNNIFPGTHLKLLDQQPRFDYCRPLGRKQNFVDHFFRFVDDVFPFPLYVRVSVCFSPISYFMPYFYFYVFFMSQALPAFVHLLSRPVVVFAVFPICSLDISG